MSARLTPGSRRRRLRPQVGSRASGVRFPWGGLARLRAGPAGRPLETVGLILTVGLMAHGTAPFDFVTSSDGFGRSLQNSQWQPIVDRRIEPSAGVSLDPYAPFLSVLGTAGAFAMLGVVAALWHLQSGRSATSALVGAVEHGVVVAVVVETLQLFLGSRTFDLTGLVSNGVGVLLGAWFAAAILDRRRFITGCANPVSAVPAFFLAAVAVGQIVYTTTRAITPFDLSLSHVGLSDVRWTRLSGHVQLPFAAAVGDITSGLLAYALLAALLALYQWRRSGRVRWVRVAAVVGLTSLGCELLQLCSLVRVTDVTQPVVALAAVLLCRAVHRRIGLVSPVTPQAWEPRCRARP